MPIPFSIDRYVHEVQELVRADASHSLLPVYRKELYSRVTSYDEVFSNQWRGWLAIEAAQYVLPIFYQANFVVDAMPERVYNLPNVSVDIAVNILRKTSVQDITIQSILDQGYESFGILIQESFEDPESFPVNAVWAGKTTYNALLEVLGRDVFQRLQSNIVVGRTVDGKLNYKPWQTLTDEMFVLRTDGDAAGSAALAFASSSISTSCDMSKLLEFWEWWLTEAIPQAWELAERSSNRT